MSAQQLIIIFLARKWLIVAYLLVTMSVTLMISLSMPKQYVTNTSLVLDQPGINPITGASLPIQLTTGYMATQSDIIKSANVALAAMDIMNLLDDKTQQDGFIKGAKLSDANAKLFKQALTERNASFTGKVDEIKQKKVLLDDFRNDIAEGLGKGLDVIPSRESSIMSISYAATDPEFAAKAANAYAQAYIQTTNKLKQQSAQETADWFENQLEKLKVLVEKARENLSSYQQTHGIVATTSNEHIDLEDAKLRELSDQLIKSQLTTADLLTKKKLLLDSLANPESLKSLSEMLLSPVLQELKTDLAKFEAKRADLGVRLGINHPQYQQAEAEIASIKKQISAEMNTILHNFNTNILSSKKRDDSLSKSMSEQKEKVLKLKEAHNQIEVLKKEVENAQVAYDAVMQKAIQMRMESQIKQSNAAILDVAIEPKTSDKPKVKLNMVLSVLLGTVLGVVAALFAEMLDRRVRSPADLTDSLDLPVFGVISTPPVSKKFFRFSLGGRS